MQVFEITLEDYVSETLFDSFSIPRRPSSLIVFFFFSLKEDIRINTVGNVDAAFRKIQKSFTCFIIWRVEVSREAEI